MFAPKSEVDRLADDIAAGRISTLSELENRWKQIHSEYYDMEWTWVADHLKEWCGKSVDEITRDDVRAIITRWLDSVTALNHMLLDDARKEYSLQSRTGFGIDDPTGEADNDFVSVRGQFEADPFVKMVQDHIVTKTALAQSALALLG